MMTLRVSYTRVLSADAVTAALAADYLLWFIPAMSLQFAMVAMGSALRGTGNFKPGMIVQTATVVLNMVLAPILIFGWFTGYPMGVAGAAISTLVAVVVGVLWLSRYFSSGNEFLHLRRADWRPRFDTWASMLKIGLPAGAEFALTAVYLFIVYTVCRPFGASAQAAFGIGLRLVQSMFLPVVALAFAAGPVAGQNVGARQGRPRAHDLPVSRRRWPLASRRSRLCSATSRPNDSCGSSRTIPKSSAWAWSTLRIAVWSFVASGVVFVSSSMFQALGNAVPPLITSVSRITIVAVPIIILSQQPGFDLKTIWYISVVGTALQMVANLLLLQREFHKRFAPQLATDQPSLSA